MLLYCIFNVRNKDVVVVVVVVASHADVLIVIIDASTVTKYSSV